MEIIPREEAKAAGLKQFYTGVPCKHGHDCSRYTSTGACFQCSKASYTKWRLDNPDQMRAACKRYYTDNTERFRDKSADWNEANPGRKNAATRAWKKANAKYVAMKNAERSARIKQATPPWLTDEHRAQIKEIYMTCPDGYEVDHIQPIKGKFSCGLHVPWNLQHLPALENRKKGNRV